MARSPSSVLSAEARPSALVGSETPRVWTPALRKLTPKCSAGFECIRFAEEVLGIRLFPWQRWALIHALELLPDGTYRFRTVVLLVARQNGKSTLLLVLALWRLYVDGAPLVIGTAQNLDVAEELWQQAVDLASTVPELAAEIAHVDRTNGKKALRLTTGERYKVAAASRRGGRGLSGDLILLDELREHQNWLAWGAVTKTTMARERAQVWAASNAGDLASVVLTFLRLLAHAALGNPDVLEIPPSPPEAEDEEADSLGIFEWSAPPGHGIWDRDGWPQANPSLGHPGGVTERAISSAARTDPEAVFRTEVLCQWVDDMTPTVIPLESWDDCADERSKPVKRPKHALDVDVDEHGVEWCSVAMSDGTHVELVTPPDAGPGVEWVPAAAKKAGVREVWLDPFGPAGKLIVPLEAHGIVVHRVGSADCVRACQQLLDAVVEGLLRHVGQPRLDRAVAKVARRDVGDGAWRFSRKLSPVDVSPLIAVTLARFAASIAVDVAANVW